jgi:hypothetical protein
MTQWRIVSISKEKNFVEYMEHFCFLHLTICDNGWSESSDSEEKESKLKFPEEVNCIIILILTIYF